MFRWHENRKEKKRVQKEKNLLHLEQENSLRETEKLRKLYKI